MFITTQDGTIIVFDAEVGTASGRTPHEAWEKIRLHKADKHAREFLKARDAIIASSVGFK